MVTAKYLTNKFIKPQREKIRNQGREKGFEQGKEATARLWIEWNGRRVEAERMNVPFNEPPPGAETSPHNI